MIALGILFSLLAGLVIAMWIAPNVPWQAKFAATVIVPFWGFFAWHALASQAGWPVAKNLPRQALLVSSVTVEPKVIYVWMIPEPPARLPFDYRPSDGEPRAYRLPYSRQQQAALQRAAHAQAQGQHVQLRLAGKPGSPIARRLYRPYAFPAPLPPKEGS